MQQIEKQEQVKVQEGRDPASRKELIATVLKGSEIERQRIENIANAGARSHHHGGRGPRCRYQAAG